MSDTVVSADWLADRLDEVRVVDVRDPWEFEGIGHIPGAVSIPFDEYRGAGEGEEGKLPGAENFARLLSAAGITNDDHLVAYDDTHGVFAARFLVTAELYGHPREKLHLLDGDYSAWLRAHEVTTAVREWPESDYAATFTPGPLVEKGDVEAAIDAETLLVDTREPWEFEEGHLPGAVQVDWRELVDDETRGLMPREDLLALLESRGVTPDRQIILYCNTARRISHTYVVLRHLGFSDLGFYEGSLTEWEAEGGALV
jgi:thiosulfate/3-mercaptopyruvate sulfurtransferase